MGTIYIKVNGSYKDINDVCRTYDINSGTPDVVDVISDKIKKGNATSNSTFRVSGWYRNQGSNRYQYDRDYMFEKYEHFIINGTPLTVLKSAYVPTTILRKTILNGDSTIYSFGSKSAAWVVIWGAGGGGGGGGSWPWIGTGDWGGQGGGGGGRGYYYVLQTSFTASAGAPGTGGGYKSNGGDGEASKLWYSNEGDPFLSAQGGKGGAERSTWDGGQGGGITNTTFRYYGDYSYGGTGGKKQSSGGGSLSCSRPRYDYPTSIGSPSKSIYETVSGGTSNGDNNVGRAGGGGAGAGKGGNSYKENGQTGVDGGGGCGGTSRNSGDTSGRAGGSGGIRIYY